MAAAAVQECASPLNIIFGFGLNFCLDVNILAPWDDYPLGWASICPVSSPIRRNPNASVLPDIAELHLQRPKSFIHHHLRSMNPCTHYSHIHLNGQLLNFGAGPRPRQRYHPSFSMSKTTLHSDILVVAPENWVEDVGVDPEWEEKSHDTLLWRGSTTGMSHKYSRAWKNSQRLRLIAMTNQHNGTYEVLRTAGPDWAVGAPISMSSEILNQRLMDTAFVGKASQCEPVVCKVIEEEYKFTSEHQSWNDANTYKYMLDVSNILISLSLNLPTRFRLMYGRCSIAKYHRSCSAGEWLVVKIQALDFD
jgi:hypothetical protein